MNKRSVEIEEVMCNLCGLTCNFGCKENEMYAPQGLINQKVCGSYESTAGNGHGALDDITGYQFSLCEFCLDWLFGQFKVPVKTWNYMEEQCNEPDDPNDLRPIEIEPPWKPAIERVCEDDWRKGKQEFFNEFKRRNMARNIKIAGP